LFFFFSCLEYTANCDNFTADQKADLEWTFPVDEDDKLPWVGVEHKTLEDAKTVVSSPFTVWSAIHLLLMQACGYCRVP